MDTGEEKISYDSQPGAAHCISSKQPLIPESCSHETRSWYASARFRVMTLLDAGQIPFRRPGIHNASRYLACCVLTIL